MMPRDDKNTSVFVDGDLSHAESRRGGEFFSRKERIDRKGWKRVRLGDFGEVLRGVSFDGQKDIRPQNSVQSVAIFRSNNIQDATINHSDLIYVRKSRVNQLQLMRSNDILICMANGSKKLVGKSALFKGAKQEFSFGAFMGVFRCFNDTMASFIAYLLQTNQYREYIDVLLSGSSINNLRPSDIENLEFSIPPSSEQLRIANTLKLCDDHISALQSLIAKYGAIKKATVNLLLKSKAGWRKKSLGDLAFIKTGGRNTQDAVASGQYPFFVRSPKVERINTYSFDGEAVLVAGDGVGAGKVFHYINGKHDCHQRVYRVRDFSPDILGRFVYRVLSEQFPVYMERCNDKASVDSLRLPAFKSFPVYYPDIDEQRRIVEILDSIDGTINGLKSQLAKEKDIKQGMMSYFFG